MVELMRLPSRPHEELVGDRRGRRHRPAVEASWRDPGRPVIVTAGHIGNNEAVAAALAGPRLPDQRHRGRLHLSRAVRVPAPASARSGASSIIPWRNLRELYGVLRRKEILALLVDWGYRSDGIPVRLFGAWTTLPAGPAALAAKTDAWIAPRRHPPDARRQDPDRGARPVRRRVVRPRGPPARDPADRRRARGDHPRRAGPVVQLQAGVARPTRTSPASSRPRRRACSAGPRPEPPAGPS